jgi:hypothetical protein
MRRVVVLSVFAFLAATGGAFADQHSPGQWVKQGDFAQMNVFCRQVWRCTPGVDVLHPGGTRIVTTPDEGTNGTCSADGGAADSCNICVTGPPSDPCEYWQENE